MGLTKTKHPIPLNYKNIKGYENLYAISPDGSIFSSYSGKEIKQDINSCGYKRVVLCKNKKKKRFLVHRLVACSYLQNIENKEQVNHKDGNKLNNNKDNLEWCTPTENMRHSWEHGLIKITENMSQEINKKIPNAEVDRLIKSHKNGSLEATKEAKAFKCDVSTIYKRIYRAKETA